MTTWDLSLRCRCGLVRGLAGCVSAIVVGLSMSLSPAALAQSDQTPSSTPSASSDFWVQGYARDHKDCIEWTDSCVNCSRTDQDLPAFWLAMAVVGAGLLSAWMGV